MLCIFLEKVHYKFNDRIDELLNQRVEYQNIIDSGSLPSFDPKTEDIRNSEWSVRPIPNNLKDRRVEITGPVDRKNDYQCAKFQCKCFYG